MKGNYKLYIVIYNNINTVKKVEGGHGKGMSSPPSALEYKYNLDATWHFSFE